MEYPKDYISLTKVIINKDEHKICLHKIKHAFINEHANEKNVKFLLIVTNARTNQSDSFGSFPNDSKQEHEH